MEGRGTRKEERKAGLDTYWRHLPAQLGGGILGKPSPLSTSRKGGGAWNTEAYTCPYIRTARTPLRLQNPNPIQIRWLELFLVGITIAVILVGGTWWGRRGRPRSGLEHECTR